MKLNLFKKEYTIIFFIVSLISLFALFETSHALNKTFCIYMSASKEGNNVSEEKVGNIIEECQKVSPYSKQFFSSILPVFIISLVSVIPLFFIQKNIHSKSRLLFIFLPYIIFLILTLLFYLSIKVIGATFIGMILIAITMQPYVVMIFITPVIAFIVCLIYTVILYRKQKNVQKKKKE